MTRKKGLWLVWALLFSVAAVQAEDLIENGDFSNGKSHWKGYFQPLKEGDNTVARVELNKSRIREMMQTVNTRKVKDFFMTMKYRTSPDYDGRGMIIRFLLPDGSSTYRTMRLDNKTQDWKTVDWDFSQVGGAAKIILVFEFLEGTGTVFIDDVTAKTEEDEKKPAQ